MILKITVREGQGELRLDEAVSSNFDSVSKSEARRIIDRGGCIVNSRMVRIASRLVSAGDVIEIGIIEPGRFKDLLLPPEAVLYEDADFVAVNKPKGVNTQRTPYQLKGTLEYWVTEYFRQQANNEPARVVHRLDRGTSGVIIFPKNRRTAAHLSTLFHDGLVDKRYLALVSGIPHQDIWEVDAPIGKIGSARYGIVQGGKAALTKFRVVSLSDGLALVEAHPISGRTHQIRVHLNSSGLPIVGDSSYGGMDAQRMMLHCAGLSFCSEKGMKIIINAPLDSAFEEMMRIGGLILPSSV